MSELIYEEKREDTLNVIRIINAEMRPTMAKFIRDTAVTEDVEGLNRLEVNVRIPLPDGSGKYAKAPIILIRDIDNKWKIYTL